MLTAGSLIIGFLVAYVGKVFLLGKEDLSVWSDAAINTLHFHEACVTAMLLMGVVALNRDAGRCVAAVIQSPTVVHG